MSTVTRPCRSSVRNCSPSHCLPHGAGLGSKRVLVDVTAHLRSGRPRTTRPRIQIAPSRAEWEGFGRVAGRAGVRAYRPRLPRCRRVQTYESIVIGAGQAGLSASYHLRRLGIDHVVLDANERAGGAWQHRWESLSMDDVHGVADLPDSPAPGRGTAPANRVVPEWSADYEQEDDLPVPRPVRVDRGTSE